MSSLRSKKVKRMKKRGRDRERLPDTKKVNSGAGIGVEFNRLYEWWASNASHHQVMGGGGWGGRLPVRQVYLQVELIWEA